MDNKHITLVVTGSIAAVKTFDLVQFLQEKGMVVSIVLTDAAQQWITKEAASLVTGQPVVMAADINNDSLANADAILVAPTSADFLKQLAYKDTKWATAIRESGKPLLVAPAMNMMMWQHPATQRNAKQLHDEGVHFLGPVEGKLACGDVGYGRFIEPSQISDAVNSIMGGDLNHPALSIIEQALTPQPQLPALVEATALKPKKDVLLVIQGGKDALASYSLISSLRSRGYNVKCAIGDEAKNLLPSEGIATISNQRAYTHHYQEDVQGMEHIRLPEESDIVLVVPATAKGVKEMAQGGAQSFAGCLYLASKVPVILVPSADPKEDIAVADVERLKHDGVSVLQVPKQLPLASKARAEAVVAALDQLMQQKIGKGNAHGA